MDNDELNQFDFLVDKSEIITFLNNLLKNHKNYKKYDFYIDKIKLSYNILKRVDK